MKTSIGRRIVIRVPVELLISTGVLVRSESGRMRVTERSEWKMFPLYAGGVPLGTFVVAGIEGEAIGRGAAYTAALACVGEQAPA